MNRHETRIRFIAQIAEMMWDQAANTFCSLAPVTVEEILQDEEMEYALAEALASSGGHAATILAAVRPTFTSASDYRKALLEAHLRMALQSLRNGEEPCRIIPALNDYVAGTAEQATKLRTFFADALEAMRERTAILTARYPLMVANPIGNIWMEYGSDAVGETNPSVGSAGALASVIKLVDARCGGDRGIELAELAFREGGWPLWQALFTLPKSILRGIDRTCLSAIAAEHVTHAIAYVNRFEIPAKFR